LSTDKRILLGRITNAHGLKGEVVVHAFTEHLEAIAEYGPLADTDGQHAIELSIVRVTDKGVIARVSGVNDRTQAEALKGRELWVAREQLPEAEDGSFYYSDLVGLDAVTPEGSIIGKVVAVQNFGASDLLEIKPTGTRQTELVAFTDDFVPEVDIAGGRVVVIMADGPAASLDDES